MSVLPRASCLTPTSSRSFHTWGCRIRNSGVNRHGYNECLLSGVKRTSQECTAMSAFDPKRTLAVQYSCDAQHGPAAVDTNQRALRSQTETDDVAVPEPGDGEDDTEKGQQHAEDEEGFAARDRRDEPVEVHPEKAGERSDG